MLAVLFLKTQVLCHAACEDYRDTPKITVYTITAKHNMQALKHQNKALKHFHKQMPTANLKREVIFEPKPNLHAAHNQMRSELVVLDHSTGMEAQTTDAQGKYKTWEGEVGVYPAFRIWSFCVFHE